jgi:hypothetical protein
MALTKKTTEPPNSAHIAQEVVDALWLYQDAMVRYDLAKQDYDAARARLVSALHAAGVEGFVL